ncbi:MAG: hypothetical protein AAFX06_10685 [Planctomycetota bacterium]
MKRRLRIAESVFAGVVAFVCTVLGARSGWTQDNATVLAPNPTAVSNWAPAEVELSRFKKQTLQSVSFTAGGLLTGRDDVDVSFLQLGVGTGIPLGSFDNVVGVTPQFRVDWVDASSAFDIPSHLYTFEMQFLYRRVISERLSLIGIFSPSSRSDLTTSDNAFRVFGLGLVNWDWIPDRLTVSAGVVALGRADLPVLPALGLSWTPNRRMRLDLRFPETRFSYRVAKDGGRSEVWLYSAVGLGGNTWAVTRDNGLTDELSLRDYRLTLGIERLVDGGGGCFAECGAALGRRLEYERDPLETELADAFSLRAGWRY